MHESKFQRQLCHGAERELSRLRRGPSKSIAPFAGTEIAVMLGAILILAVAADMAPAIACL